MSEVEVLVGELELRIDRLRALYDQYFSGLEKLEPLVPRKDVERRLEVLRRQQIRNTGLRFKFQTLVQRYNTYQMYWQRIVRQIDSGTYKRDVLRAKARFGEDALKPGSATRTAPEATAPRTAGERAGRDELSYPIDVVEGEAESSLDDSLDAAFDAIARPVARTSIPPELDLDEPDGTPSVRPGRLPAPPSHLDLDGPPSSVEPPSSVGRRVVKRDGNAPPSQRGAPLPPRGAPPPLAKGGPPPATKPAGPPAKPPVPTGAAKPIAAKPAAPGGAPAPPAPGTAHRGAPPPRPPQGMAARGPAPASPARGPAPAPPARTADPATLPEARVRQLYTQYVDAKRAKGESTATVTFEGLEKSLRESSAKLREKVGAGRSIDFEVAVKDGKTILKPVVR